MTLAEDFLTFIKEQKDYDHITPKLDDQITPVNQILTVYARPNDNYVVMFQVCMDLHHTLLEIINISTRIELNKMRKAYLSHALEPESNIQQWANASLTINSIPINVKKSPNVSPEKLLVFDRLSMVIYLRLSLTGDYNFGSRLAGLLDEIVPQAIPISKREHRIKYKIRHPHQDEWKDVKVDGNKSDTIQAYQPQAN